MRWFLLTLAGLVALASAAFGQSVERMHYFRSAWTPYGTLDNSAAIAAEWDASRPGLMVNDGGGLISSWTGIKGLAVTATTTARGTWGATSFNNAYPGITCDGTANNYTTTSLSALPTGSTAGEIWVVASPVSSGSTTTPVAYGNSGASVSRQLRKNTTDRPNVFDGSSVNLNGTSQTFTGPHIHVGQWSGTTELGWMDGAALNGNPATISTLNTSTTRLRICANATASAGAFFSGVVADVWVFSGTLSDADRSRMFCYLAWKWGLRANLPASINCGSPP